MSAPRTPIERWPAAGHRGKPGYSARHYRDLAGAAEDPLRVAERITAREDADRLCADVERRLSAGETVPPMFDAISHARQRRWAELCSSFDEVIAVLEREHRRAPTKALKRLIAEARQAANEAKGAVSP